MDYEEIIYTREDGIGTITLNHPANLNALGTKIRLEILDALEKIKKDDGIRVMILTGAGRAFCSGADLKELQGPDTPDLKKRRFFLDTATARVMAFIELGKPVIAAVNGIAAGGGLSMVMASDIRIASDQARFAATFVRRALVPDGGLTFTLTRALGVGKAAEVMFTGDILDANEAERLGIVNKVVPHNELMKYARDMALKISKNGPLALKFAKQAMYRSLTSDARSQLEFEAECQMKIFQTEDFQEGMKSFLEKREPSYKGK